MLIGFAKLCVVSSYNKISWNMEILKNYNWTVSILKIKEKIDVSHNIIMTILAQNSKCSRNKYSQKQLSTTMN